MKRSERIARELLLEGRTGNVISRTDPLLKSAGLVNSEWAERLRARYPQRRYDHTWTDRQIMHYEGIQFMMDLIEKAAEGVDLPDE